MTKITIITLTYNQLFKATKPFLDSLYKYTDERDFDLIIVDNASTDGTVEYIKAFKEIHNNITIIENSKNLGYSKGNNQGLRILTSDVKYAGLFNNDILFTPNWLDISLAVIEKDDKIGLASPRINKNKKVKMNPQNYLYKYQKFLSKFKNEFDYDISSYFCCVIIKKEVIDKVGFLDEMFTPAFYEDDDYIFRTLYAGYKCGYINKSFIYHNHQTSSGIMPHKQKILEKNQLQFFEKHSLGKYIWEHKRTNLVKDIFKYLKKV